MKKKATDILEDYSNSYSQVDLETLIKFLEQIKSEAIEEFAEHLKEEWFNNYYDSPDVDFDDFVDNLVKEMVGENNA